MARCALLVIFFFFNDTATTEIYTLSLHDALPIYLKEEIAMDVRIIDLPKAHVAYQRLIDRKSTRLNSSHQIISYAVFCLKKKKNNISSQQHHNDSQSEPDQQDSLALTLAI